MKSLHNLGFRKCGIVMFLFLILVTTLSGQSKVKIHIIDSLSSHGVEFATATLTEVGKSEIYRYGVADSTGKTEIGNVAYGKYILKVDHLNYTFVTKEITVNSKETELGSIRIRERANTMSSVTVTAMANPIKILPKNWTDAKVIKFA